MFLISEKSLAMCHVNVIPSQTFLKKNIYKRFLSLRNTPAHCIAFVVNPSPEFDRLSFISAEEHAVVVFYCPGPRPPRGGTSLEKLCICICICICSMAQYMYMYICICICSTVQYGGRYKSSLNFYL